MRAFAVGTNETWNPLRATAALGAIIARRSGAWRFVRLQPLAEEAGRAGHAVVVGRKGGAVGACTIVHVIQISDCKFQGWLPVTLLLPTHIVRTLCTMPRTHGVSGDVK